MLNRQTRIWIMLGIASFALMVSGYIVGERQGLLVGFSLALGIIYLVYHYSSQHWIDYFKATQLEGQDPWQLQEIVRQIATKARIPSPKIFIIKSDFPTAFSVARSIRSSAIVVSEGLLKYLDTDELKAVVACEISKIRRLDTFYVGVVSGLTAPVFIFCNLVDHTITFLSLGLLRHRHLARQLCEKLMEIFARPIVGQKTFFESDYQAGQLLMNPESLAKTLWKLKGYATSRKLEIPPNAAPFLTVNPLTSDKKHRYFHVQPSVDLRIEKLMGRFPI